MNTDDLDIVGFIGSVLVDCARNQAVAQLRGTDKCFRLAASGEIKRNQQYYSSVELGNFSSLRMLTLLPKPVPGTLESMVVYVTRRFLEVFDYQGPEDLSGSFDWQRLSPDLDYQNETNESLNEKNRLQEGAWAASADRGVIEIEMNRWARRLIRLAADKMLDYYAKHNSYLREEAEQIINMALYAARSRLLRAHAYVYYGAIIIESDTEDRLDRLFEKHIKSNFDWTWETYQVRVRRLIDVLRIKASVPMSFTGSTDDNQPLIIPLSTDPIVMDAIKKEIGFHVSQLSPNLVETDIEAVIDEIDRVGTRFALEMLIKDTKDIADELNKLLRLITLITEKKQRFDICKQVSSECSKVFNLDQTLYLSVAMRISRTSKSYSLDRTSLQVLASTPSFFYKPALNVRSDLPPLLDVPIFLDAVDEIDRDFELDDFATLILHGVTTEVASAGGGYYDFS